MSQEGSHVQVAESYSSGSGHSCPGDGHRKEGESEEATGGGAQDGLPVQQGEVQVSDVSRVS